MHSSLDPQYYSPLSATEARFQDPTVKSGTMFSTRCYMLYFSYAQYLPLTLIYIIGTVRG